ncbi:MAG: LacI family DNA-binding transcriptional regulator [Acidimicrobiia bacterium]|nr:MAG: LacI family DNA-binding transcriptional regulator [Acidimicrobiia bacterium]
MKERPSGIDRPTIIDVAEVADVSRQTVSRVLSDHPRVAPATRRRVKEAIEKLGYRPNRMARALVTRTSLTFGFAAVDMRNSHFGDTCSGMQAAAREHGYYLVVTELDFNDDRGMGTLETLLTLGVDGVAFFPSFLEDTEIELFAATSGCPVVMIGRESKIPNVVSIAIDETRAADLIVDHLVDTRKRHIGILMNEMFPDIVHERFVALQRAVANRTEVARSPVVADHPKISHGRDAATRLLQKHPDVDAVVGFNDTMAMGALLACHDLGLRVPEDVAVVGYDGSPFGVITNPPLTTIVQDSIGMADAAFKALLSCVEEGTPSEGEVLLWQPELLVRGST